MLLKDCKDCERFPGLQTGYVAVIFKKYEKNHKKDYKLFKIVLIPERILECDLSEDVSAHVKENKVPGNSSMDLSRVNHAS